MSRWFSLAILTISAVMFMPGVRAQSGVPGHWLHGAGRHLGVGWSDGYHSRTACLPRRAAQVAPRQAPPWWTIPAAESGPLPHPAAEPYDAPAPTK
jgi:hypothetical protein